MVVIIESNHHCINSKQAAVATESATTDFEGQTVAGLLGSIVLAHFQFGAIIALEPAGTGIVLG